MLDVKKLLLFVIVLPLLSSGSKVNECRQITVQKELFLALRDTISTCVAEVAPGTNHIVLLDSGIPLSYQDFYPGPTLPEAGQSLPTRVIENAQKLVNIIPLPHQILFANSTTHKTQRSASVSSVYDFILEHMMVTPKNLDSEVVLRAKCFLQEQVPNPERVVTNEAQLPRFLLYDYYRHLYLQKKNLWQETIDTNRDKKEESDFEEWSLKTLPLRDSDLHAVFEKWQVFGYKAEVEKQLQYLEVDSHEEKLLSSRALFKSQAKISLQNLDKVVYPVSFSPANWYLSIKASLPESADELHYKTSLIQAQIASLNATMASLRSESNEEVQNTMEEVTHKLEELNQMVENGVSALQKLEVSCLMKVNIAACQNISNGHSAFHFLLQEVAQHYAQVEYLKSILNRREKFISILLDRISELNAQKKVLQYQLDRTETAELSNSISTQDQAECSDEEWLVHLFFKTEEVITDNDCSERQGKDENNYCSEDLLLPANVTHRELWHLQSCAVDSELRAFGLLKNFTKTMNAASAQITAALHKVDILRPWFDITVFEDAHMKMVNGSGVVSPGPLTPENYFHEVVSKGKYLLPEYPSSFVIASNIKILFTELGIDSNETEDILNILMKYAYANTLTGGYGPFTFAPVGHVRKDPHNFRVERKNGGILVSLPSAQVIGYITTVVPKFPHDQAPPPNRSCLEPPETKRRKRSAAEAAELAQKEVNIREMVNYLLKDSPTKQHGELDGEISPSASINKLLDESAATKGRIQQLLEKFDSSRKSSGEVEDLSVLFSSSPATHYNVTVISTHSRDVADRQ